MWIAKMTFENKEDLYFWREFQTTEDKQAKWRRLAYDSLNYSKIFFDKLVSCSFGFARVATHENGC